MTRGVGRVIGTWNSRTIELLAFFSALGILGTVSHRGGGTLPDAHVDRRANVRGSVTFTGSIPQGEPVDMGTHRFCAAAHAGEQVVSQPVVVGAGGELRDVLIYVKAGAEGQRFSAPEGEVLLDQQDCLYTPHVVALRAGQTLVIRNSDRTLHNVHVTAANNRGFNIGQPLPGIESRRTFAVPEIGIEVTCDVHGWMGAVLAVFDHPFFAVTSALGEFSLEDLPAGEYVIEAWHETLGTKSETVTVGADGVTEVSFVF